MNSMVKLTAFASILALASISAPHFAAAQESSPRLKCIGNDCAGSGTQNEQDQGTSGRRIKNNQQPDFDNEQDQGTSGRIKKIKQPDVESDQDQVIPGRRFKKLPQDEQVQQDDDNDGTPNKKIRRAGRDWKFDSNRHERRRSKDNRFRFYFGGFWYPEPYWDFYDVGPYRVSCGEGREIVAERFNRVRVVECSGRVYTYLGRRHGDTFEVMLNSRTGRIVGTREI